MLNSNTRKSLGAVPAGRRLKVLDILCAEGLRKAHAAVKARIGMHAQVNACAQDRAQVPSWARIQNTPRYVALVRSGMDCDGVQYVNDVCYVRAHWRDVIERIDNDCAYADGPMNHIIVAPSYARKLKPYSRDLLTEAFENGHAWSLHA